MTAQYRIGETYPLDGVRGIQGGQRIAPTWFCLFCPPQKEIATREHLRAHGVYAFFPSREKRWALKGKTYRRELPEVTGYVFAQFKYEPQWDVMKEGRRLITGVLGGSHPYPINREVIRHMQGLTVEAQKLEAARREMMRVREGDKAKIVEGPLAGFVVDVRQIHGNEAMVDGPLSGRMKASLSTLERLIGLG